MMDHSKRAQRIRALAESLSDDEAARDRLKQKADESLARLHHAVRELVETRRPGDVLKAAATSTRQAGG
jgi:hypothetical protein